jgi:hypothetical protein
LEVLSLVTPGSLSVMNATASAMSLAFYIFPGPMQSLQSRGTNRFNRDVYNTGDRHLYVKPLSNDVTEEEEADIETTALEATETALMGRLNLVYHFCAGHGRMHA